MVEATGQGSEAEETDMEFQAPPPGMLSYFTEPSYPRLSQWPLLVSAFGRGAGRYLREQQWHDELEARFAFSPSAYQYGLESILSWLPAGNSEHLFPMQSTEAMELESSGLLDKVR